MNWKAVYITFGGSQFLSQMDEDLNREHDLLKPNKRWKWVLNLDHLGVIESVDPRAREPWRYRYIIYFRVDP